MKWNHSRLSASCGLVLFLFLPLMHAAESNFWPAYVRQSDSPSGRPDQLGSLGPIFSVKQTESQKILSIRPFWTSFHDLESGDKSVHVVYPLLNWQRVGDRESTQAVLLRESRDEEPEAVLKFQLFPFVFLDKREQPEDSYFAVFPIGGVLKERFWRDRISFALWPLYVRTERGDETRLHTPYPFVQQLHGPKSRGFGLWPIYGHFEREEDYEKTWALWPIYYDLKTGMDKEVPYERYGILPFYTRETAAGLKSETFGWPFFGYTREWEPRVEYSENRYFWPLFVQARGDEQNINRWMPFYTHETKPGREKTWYLWPLLKTDSRNQEGVVSERSSLLYFVFVDEQRKYADATTRLTTVWPLAAAWDDGRGSRQVQILDPLTVFFPNNRKVKENWSPLFALYRYDEQSGHGRHSLFWDLVVFERDATGPRSFYLGPLFEWVEGSHWDILKGLVGSSHDNDNGGLRLLWMNLNKN